MHKIIFTKSRLIYDGEMKRIIQKTRVVPNVPSTNVHPNVKFMTIIACHPDSILKVKTTMNNIQRLTFLTNTIVVVSSNDAKYSDMLQSLVSVNAPHVHYAGIPNTPHLDIGKWVYFINNYYEGTHDYVVFTNDSFLIQQPIYNFYNMMVTRNVELYGYNDSSQIKYHYQSYLFGIKNNHLDRLLTHYERIKHKLKTYMDVVTNIELELANIYVSKDCFLKIAYYKDHTGRNVFFNNDELYNLLQRANVLPFQKLKRILRDMAPPPPKHPHFASHQLNGIVNVK